MARMSGEDVGEPEADEVLDEVLEKKLNGEIGKLKDQNFNNAIAVEYQNATAKQPDFTQARDTFVANTAYGVLIEAQSNGQQLTNEQAIEMASNAIRDREKAVYENNPTPGAVANYIYSQALRAGYQPPTVKPTGQTPQNKVNIKAAARAVEEAGAPVIKKEAVGMTNSEYGYDPVKEGKDAGFSAKYMRKMGY